MGESRRKYAAETLPARIASNNASNASSSDALMGWEISQGSEGRPLHGVRVLDVSQVARSGASSCHVLLSDASALDAGRPALYGAMRGALYFDRAAIGEPVAVLSGWLVAGVVLMLVGEMIVRRRAAVAITAG